MSLYRSDFFQQNAANYKLIRRTQDAPDVLNAQALGIFRPIVGISSRVKGKPTMRLSVMSQKKKKLLLKIRNF
jgi:hypothetical protein